jgi:hypothetical protein
LHFFQSCPTRQTLLDDWIEQHPSAGRKIIIPADLKWEIRDKLDQANITERVLFPGLDGLSKWLKRHYSPRYESISHEFQAHRDLIGYPRKASNE